MRHLLNILSWPFRHLPIALSLFIFTSLLLGAGYYFSYANIRQSYRVLRTQEEETQLRMVERLTREVDTVFGNYLTKVHNFTVFTATAMQLTGLEGAYRYYLNQGTLNRYMSVNSEIVAVSIIDGLGRQLVDQQLVDVTAEDFQSYFEQGARSAFQGQHALSSIIRIVGQPAPFVVVTDPVTDNGGTHVASISVVISLGEMLDYLLKLNPTKHNLFLCDDRGYLITHSMSGDSDATADLFPGSDYTFHPLVRNFMTSGGRIHEVISYQRHGNIDHLGTYALCDRLPWLVGAEIPHKDAFASIFSMQRQLKFWVVITFVCSLILTLLMLFGLRLPLLQLLDATHHISERDFEHKIEVNATNEFGRLALTFDEMRVSILSYLIQIQAAARKNKETFMRALQALVNAIDAKDPYTKGHSQRVSRYAGIIAREIGQAQEDLEKTELSALLHDVGKIGIDDKILKKPAPLTAAEYNIMKKHPDKGMAILGTIDELREITDGMHFHHENWDGKGYPQGLKGADIPLQARIVAVADAFDAMTTNRPYQIAMSYDQAVSRLQELAGKRFDPDIVRSLAEAYYAGRLNPK